MDLKKSETNPYKQGGGGKELCIVASYTFYKIV